MVNRNITMTDIKVFLVILFVLFLGYGTKLLFIIDNSPYMILPVSLALAPIIALSMNISRVAAVVISMIIFLGYSSLRFFRSIPLFYITVFGGMLVASYIGNMKLTRTLDLFPVVAVIAVPQLIHLFIYLAFRRNKEGN